MDPQIENSKDATMPLTLEEFDGRLRKIEQALAGGEISNAHQEKALEEVKEQLDTFIHQAQKCDLVPELDRKVISLHSRIDKLAQDYAVMYSQHESCMKTSDRDNVMLLSIQKDIIELKIMTEQKVSTIDMQKLQITVDQLAVAKVNTEKFIVGRMGGVFDAVLKIIIAACLGWYVYSNGIRTQTIVQPSNVSVHTHETGPDEQHDQPMVQKLLKELEDHKAEDLRKATELMNQIQKR
jgi:hypothetical protein